MAQDATSAMNAPAVNLERLSQARQALLGEVRKRIVGQDEVLDLLLTSLFAGGHCLLIGVPGLAKTMLVQTLAETLSLNFQRVQFTPDLMPADITGIEVLDEDPETGRRSFRFSPGPIFTNILLADEINRTPPKTQAALLQSMAEGHVTSAGKTRPLEPPFVVFATQNPIEQEGTYPLPEAQLDRFLFQIDVGYPSAEEEREIVRRTTGTLEESITPVLRQEEVIELRELCASVPVADHVIDHAVALTRATRPEHGGVPSDLAPYIAYGAGPRASQSLIRAAKARAALEGRFVAEVADVRSVAQPVLQHRIVRSFRASAERVSAAEIVERLLQATAAS